MKTVKAPYHGKGGVHPAYHKDATASRAIESLPMPPQLLVSLAQHLGAPARPLVKKGDSVARGQPIGEPAGYISSWVHAPAAGTVKAVEDLPAATGKSALTVVLEPAGEDRLHESCMPPADWTALPGNELVDRVARAGIIGMGGAGFPTHVKLTPPPGKPMDTLLVNGAECEPYLTADHRLMLERPERIVLGARILRQILGAKALRVAVEDNKPDAIRALEKALQGLDGDVELVVLRTDYPQGAEKQLIESVLGREVPSGKLPMDVGALVENVATAAAVADAVTQGLPLLRRVVTVTGIVRDPRNVEAPVGAPLQALVDFCGGLSAPVAKVVCGGPMMGIALPSLEAGVSKTTSGLLSLGRESLPQFSSMPCIACGRCVQACPMRLMPCTLSECMEAEQIEALEAGNALDCIECGCCAYVCPARRPMVQHLKQGKARVTLLRRQREASKKKES
jgi:electron transport complex protein RnfC